MRDVSKLPSIKTCWFEGENEKREREGKRANSVICSNHVYVIGVSFHSIFLICEGQHLLSSLFASISVGNLPVLL